MPEFSSPQEQKIAAEAVLAKRQIAKLRRTLTPGMKRTLKEYITAPDIAALFPGSTLTDIQQSRELGLLELMQKDPTGFQAMQFIRGQMGKGAGARLSAEEVFTPQFTRAGGQAKRYTRIFTTKELLAQSGGTADLGYIEDILRTAQESQGVRAYGKKGNLIFAQMAEQLYEGEAPALTGRIDVGLQTGGITTKLNLPYRMTPAGAKFGAFTSPASEAGGLGKFFTARSIMMPGAQKGEIISFEQAAKGLAGQILQGRGYYENLQGERIPLSGKSSLERVRLLKKEMEGLGKLLVYGGETTRPWEPLGVAMGGSPKGVYHHLVRSQVYVPEIPQVKELLFGAGLQGRLGHEELSNLTRYFEDAGIATKLSEQVKAGKISGEESWKLLQTYISAVAQKKGLSRAGLDPAKPMEGFLSTLQTGALDPYETFRDRTKRPDQINSVLQIRRSRARRYQQLVRQDPAYRTLHSVFAPSVEVGYYNHVSQKYQQVMKFGTPQEMSKFYARSGLQSRVGIILDAENAMLDIGEGALLVTEDLREALEPHELEVFNRRLRAQMYAGEITKEAYEAQRQRLSVSQGVMFRGQKHNIVGFLPGALETKSVTSKPVFLQGLTGLNPAKSPGVANQLMMDLYVGAIREVEDSAARKQMMGILAEEMTKRSGVGVVAAKTGPERLIIQNSVDDALLQGTFAVKAGGPGMKGRQGSVLGGLLAFRKRVGQTKKLAQYHKYFRTSLEAYAEDVMIPGAGKISVLPVLSEIAVRNELAQFTSGELKGITRPGYTERMGAAGLFSKYGRKIGPEEILALKASGMPGAINYARHLEGLTKQWRPKERLKDISMALAPLVTPEQMAELKEGVPSSVFSGIDVGKHTKRMRVWTPDKLTRAIPTQELKDIAGLLEPDEAYSLIGPDKRNALVTEKFFQSRFFRELSTRPLAIQLPEEIALQMTTAAGEKRVGRTGMMVIPRLGAFAPPAVGGRIPSLYQDVAKLILSTREGGVRRQGQAASQFLSRLYEQMPSIMEGITQPRITGNAYRGLQTYNAHLDKDLLVRELRSIGRGKEGRAFIAAKASRMGLPKGAAFDQLADAMIRRSEGMGRFVQRDLRQLIARSAEQMNVTKAGRRAVGKSTFAAQDIVFADRSVYEGLDDAAKKLYREQGFIYGRTIRYPVTHSGSSIASRVMFLDPETLGGRSLLTSRAIRDQMHADIDFDKTFLEIHGNKNAQTALARMNERQRVLLDKVGNQRAIHNYLQYGRNTRSSFKQLNKAAQANLAKRLGYKSGREMQALLETGSAGLAAIEERIAMRGGAEKFFTPMNYNRYMRRFGVISSLQSMSEKQIRALGFSGQSLSNLESFYDMARQISSMQKGQAKGGMIWKNFEKVSLRKKLQSGRSLIDMTATDIAEAKSANLLQFESQKAIEKTIDEIGKGLASSGGTFRVPGAGAKARQKLVQEVAAIEAITTQAKAHMSNVLGFDRFQGKYFKAKQGDFLQGLQKFGWQETTKDQALGVRVATDLANVGMIKEFDLPHRDLSLTENMLVTTANDTKSKIAGEGALSKIQRKSTEGINKAFDWIKTHKQASGIGLGVAAVIGGAAIYNRVFGQGSAQPLMPAPQMPDNEASAMGTAPPPPPQALPAAANGAFGSAVPPRGQTLRVPSDMAQLRQDVRIRMPRTGRGNNEHMLAQALASNTGSDLRMTIMDQRQGYNGMDAVLALKEARRNSF